MYAQKHQNAEYSALLYYIEDYIRFYTLSCSVMDKFPFFYPLHLHMLNKITTFAAKISEKSPKKIYNNDI